MFYGCSSLKSLDLLPFNTSSATNMESMFYKCSSFDSLNLSLFNISLVNNMQSMFYGCDFLVHLFLTALFTIQNLNSFENMFMYKMFSGYSKSQSLGVLSFNNSGCKNIDNMFCDCDNLIIDINYYDENNIKNCFKKDINCENIDYHYLIKNKNQCLKDCTYLDYSFKFKGDYYKKYFKKSYPFNCLSENAKCPKKFHYLFEDKICRNKNPHQKNLHYK